MTHHQCLWERIQENQFQENFFQNTAPRSHKFFCNLESFWISQYPMVFWDCSNNFQWNLTIPQLTGDLIWFMTSHRSRFDHFVYKYLHFLVLDCLECCNFWFDSDTWLDLAPLSKDSKLTIECSNSASKNDWLCQTSDFHLKRKTKLNFDKWSQTVYSN